MKRVHVVEFLDYAWFPNWLRDCMTNNIVVIATWIGVPAALGGLIKRVVKEEGIDRVVDLGSGGGGVMPRVIAEVRKDPDTSGVGLTMTDLYPNQDAIKQFNGDDPQLTYLQTPVDATDLASAPDGLKTMCNAFHHMRPDMARKILKSAHDNRQPLLIYEMGQNIPVAAWAISLPLMLPLIFVTALVLSAFVRPLTFRHAFFSYVIPVIPLFYAWDGHASTPRIYTLDDLDTLLEGLDSPGYRWEKALAKDAGKGPGIYLLGVPVNEA